MKRFESVGEEYTTADLAQEVGIDKERAELLLSQGNTISLEQPVDDGPRPRPLDRFLSDDEAPQPDSEAIQAQELNRMDDAFHALLTERQRFVLTRRYGLDDGEFRTLSEVGKEMGLSRERVRQIEREALTRLRDQSGIRGPVARVADGSAPAPERTASLNEPRPTPRCGPGLFRFCGRVLRLSPAAESCGRDAPSSAFPPTDSGNIGCPSWWRGNGGDRSSPGAQVRSTRWSSSGARAAGRANTEIRSAWVSTSSTRCARSRTGTTEDSQEALQARRSGRTPTATKSPVVATPRWHAQSESSTPLGPSAGERVRGPSGT